MNLFFRDDTEQGAPGIGGEALLPERRGELVYVGAGVVRDSLQDVDEIGVRVDAVHLAGDDEALENAHVLGVGYSRVRLTERMN